METISITQIKINMIEEITQALSEKIEAVGAQTGAPCSLALF